MYLLSIILIVGCPSI